MKSIEDPDLQISRKPGQVFSEVDGEIIMLSVENEEYYALNEVGSAIWKYLGSPRKLNEIIELLLHDFEIGRDQCKTETISFLEELRTMDLIEFQD